MPNFRPATIEQILEQLPKWQQELLQIDQGELTDEQLDQTLDAEFMVMQIMDQPPKKLRGVIDSSGQVKAVASISYYPDAICLEYLITAPKSLHLMLNPKRVRGAATALLLCLIHESFDLGFGGKIKAYSVESAIDFYKDLGFVEKVGVTLMPEMAKKLLIQYGETIK